MADARGSLVIRAIIREIVTACTNAGQPVSEQLAAFMVRRILPLHSFTGDWQVIIVIVVSIWVQVKAVVINPATKFQSEANMTKEDVAQLIQARRPWWQGSCFGYSTEKNASDWKSVVRRR